jgi:putative transcriptional regulator
VLSSQLAPGLLIASPPLGDPNFDRSVVLLAIHNEHGALGFIVNRLAPLQIGELLGLAGYGDGLGEVKGSVYVGGPVEPSSGWVLGTREDLGLVSAEEEAEAAASSRPRAGGPASSPGGSDGVIPVGDRLVVTSSRKVFDEIARRARDGGDVDIEAARRLVLLGYSGWGPGQLEGEIAHGAWLPSPVHEAILFETDPPQRWQRTYETLGVSTLGAIGMRTVGDA